MYAIIIVNVGLSLYGLALGVIAYRAYNLQAKILSFGNRYEAFSIARYQAIIGSTLMASLAILIPALQYGATWFWLATICYPFVAAITSGGYDHLRQTWLSMPYTTAHTIFHSIDRLLGLIPQSLFKIGQKFLNFSHRNMGKIYIYMQIGLFISLLTTGNLFLGLSGLFYISLAELRAHRYLPDAITYGLEKIDYWVNQYAEVILRSTVLGITAILQIAHGLVFNLLVPKIIRRLTGAEREFWHVADLRKHKELPDRISKDISLQDFKELLQQIPRVARLESNTANASRIELLASELDILTQHVRKEYNNMHVEAQSIETTAQQHPPQNHAEQDALSILYKLFYPQTKKLYALLIKLRLTIQQAAEKDYMDRGYTVSALHMTHVPQILPKIDLKFSAIRQVLQGHYRSIADKSTDHLHDAINFSAYDLALAAEWREIKAQKASLLQQSNTTTGNLDTAKIHELLVKNAAEIAKFTEMQIEHWRYLFNLPADLDPSLVFAEYIYAQLKKVCDEIELCNTMLTNYKLESLVEFQTKGKHVLKHVLDLIASGDDEKISLAYKVLVNIALEANSPVGIHDAVDAAYYKHVFPLLCEQDPNLNTYDKMTIYLQKLRYELYADLYEAISTNVVFATLLYNVDFKGRNAQMAVMKALAPLNLQGQFNTQSELANDPSLFEEILINFFAYSLARAMMTFKNGYSPEYIIERLTQDDAGALCMSWAAEFNPEVQDYIRDTLHSSASDEDKRHIYTALLYSMRVLCCTKPEVQQKIEVALPQAKEPVIAQTDPILTYAWQSAQYACAAMYNVVDYITREPNEAERQQMQQMCNTNVQF